MKINSTVILTFFLLLMMMGAGSVSAWFGYDMGAKSLEGVSEPDSNPTKKLTRKQGENKETELVFLKEKDIIAKNYDYIKGKKGNNKNSKPEKSESKSESKNNEKVNSQTENKEKDNFINSPDGQESLLTNPVKTNDQDVTLEVSNIKLQDGAIVLNVSLKNDSRKAVKFLYSFLDIRDDKGDLLSAITDGLPGELPANGESYNGTIRIPTALLSDAKTISLSLTDYPDQKLQLKLENLPIAVTEDNQNDVEPNPETPVNPEETPPKTEL